MILIFDLHGKVPFNVKVILCYLLSLSIIELHWNILVDTMLFL